MNIYPAIDIKGGKCVRLSQGSFREVKTYFENPVEVAKRWESEGANFLHIVDLDGALVGDTVNLSVIEEIAKTLNIPIQVGGGVRDFEKIEKLLSLGVNRVIIGTRAVREPEFVRECIERFGSERIVIGIDARNSFVATDGWEKVSEVGAMELAKKMVSLGVRHIVYTDISRDGMLSGVNLDSTRQMTELTDIEIIASGGVSGIEDLRKLKELGIRGAIIGKALYESRISLREVMEEF